MIGNDRPVPARPPSSLAEPLRAKLSDADDRIRLNHWMPPQNGIAPRIRIGRRWINTLWGLPIAVAAMLCLVALAQSLRELPDVEAFIGQHPGIAQAAPSVDSGFPWWLQLQHFLNMFFMLFIMRAGLQILADHPRLYWGRDCTPGSDWFRFQVPVPKGRVWTAKDDSVTLPTWLGIPGLRHSLGLSRWWHFSVNLLWLINGVAFYALLFFTDQWRRLVPLTWEVFPAALSTAIQYASLNFPVDHSWTRYNGLQQLSYFITVFVAAPVSIVTGLMQSPAISNALGWFGRLFNRQAMRSVHFISFAWFVGFILAHGVMVFVTGIRQNTNHMFGGVDNASWTGFPLFVIAMVVLTIAWLLASPYTIRHARLVQRVGAYTIGWIMGLAESWDARSQLTKHDISPYFWPNGTMPSSNEFDDLVADEFAGYRLRIGGLVEAPRELSLADLKAMPKQDQITTHFCIQGWSGVAEWGGVAMRDILALVKPTPEARYAVFYSLADGADGGRYYDVHKIENMRHALTILAYEMNGAPVSVLHGAPLRLRCENELGFKMVKWIAAIEFVRDFADLGAGQGGYNEDHEFYGYRMPI
ncbi:MULTISPECIES: molybdopterin-dependent oxidoreductase [Bradyrhizobium]|uniref:molybdopterin-dependent oxidoreductase n=1 Tax=Bradyrhizobium TaxID=374 RepID=UPI0023063D65|nr:MULTISPECIES: molybdopterin-dependent oxidoreductase [Bradyrhizobium]MDA9411825.1 oxidoreductase [Bradyrhizobium sp. CCBAU 45384]WLB24420.1 molybdopterin-dependent oxidoreductase [Bradyrhizobium japonicum]